VEGPSTGTASAGQIGFIILGQPGPQGAAVDPATGTLYVLTAPSQNAHGAVDVLNALTCDALHASGCLGTTPGAQVGVFPTGIAVDQPTGTIYVANSGNSTLSVIDGATCNARDTAGCSLLPPAVHAGSSPVAVAVDQATDTVYAADWGNGAADQANGKGTTVSVINGRTCNGRVHSGCGQAPAHVSVGQAPAGVFVDQATDTVYVATVRPDGAETLWVIDGAACNAATTSGCGRTPVSVTLGTGSREQNVAFGVDDANATLYVANYGSNTLSMIDTARCNAATTSGCAQAPHTLPVGRGPNGIAVNPATHTLYVATSEDNTLSVLDTATCNATTSSGCSTSRLLRTGGFPQAVTLDQATDTIYISNGDSDSESVLNGAICNATVASGCN
jgi:YVTN family beta-propeller protein